MSTLESCSDTCCVASSFGLAVAGEKLSTAGFCFDLLDVACLSQ